MRVLKPLVLFAVLFFPQLPAVARAQTQPLSAQETRDAFLKIIDRPKVALAPETKLDSTDAGIARYEFTYATQAEMRVPGILLMKEPFARDGRRHPVVIVLHGTGGKKESELPTLKKLVQRDFIAVAIDGRYHGERGKAADYNGAIARAFEQGHEHPLYYDTVWDLMRLIDYLQTRTDVAPNRIGLIGISKGGIETWLTSAIDTRVAVSVPCISVQSFNWALENDAWHARVGTVKQGFDAAARSAKVDHPDAAFVRQFYDRVLPGIYTTFDGPKMLPLISPRPLMIINGETDDKNPLEGLKLCTDATRIAYDKANAPDRFAVVIEPKTGHAVTNDAMAGAIEWFAKWIGD